ncbi:MAG: tetratricopeptide repeat protein [Planctomycetes bacterium]|nr:tetratricopeptide repeat protein [Planctomycetota bacterium]MCB9869061.1 tetratricopeptide repeat protein [Planctomycetota bacterium]
MAAKDWSREIGAISPWVKGTTVQIEGAWHVSVPGVERSVAGSALATLHDASVDTLVSIGGLDVASDPIAALRGFARIIREGGKVVLIATDRATPAASPGQGTFTVQGLASLLASAGGFVLTKIDAVVPGETILVVAERSAVAAVRQPLGVHGPSIVQHVAASAAARTEYYFQIGTLMLQTGDPGLAAECFGKVLQQEPNSAEAHFGLGMTYATQSRWAEAMQELGTAAALDPSNAEVKRWLALARESLSSTRTVGIPTAPSGSPVGQRPVRATPSQRVQPV